MEEPGKGKRYGTYHIFPCLGDLKEIYPRHERGLILPKLPVLDGTPAPYVERDREYQSDLVKAVTKIHQKKSDPPKMNKALPELEDYDPFAEDKKDNSTPQRSKSKRSLSLSRTLETIQEADSRAPSPSPAPPVPRPPPGLWPGLGRGVRTKNSSEESQYPGFPTKDFEGEGCGCWDDERI